MNKFSRVFAILMTVALLCSALSACSSNDEPEEIATFRQYIQDNNYYDAAGYYNSTLSADPELSDLAKQVLVAFCNEIAEKTRSGEYTTADAQIKLSGLQNLISQASLEVNGFDTAVEAVNIAIVSKEAYRSAADFEAVEDYEKALKYYQSVVAGDCNYEDAQSGLARCAGAIKQAALADAQTASQSGDYLKAIGFVGAALEYLPEDGELLSAMNGYENTYVQDILTAADEMFVDPSVDYKAALAVINTALKACPDHDALNEKKEYYSSFAPVNLYDLEPMQGAAAAIDADSDALGNGYEKCFWAGYSSMEWNGTDVTFDLSKAYNVFTASVYGRSGKTTAQYLTVYIYGDGELLYEETGIADNDTEILNISVDVTGVSELRITLERDNGAISKGIGMTDMLVQKTEE